MFEQLTRRDFLQTSAALTAGASLAHTSAADEPRPVVRLDRVRVAVIGVAGQGTYNLNNVAAVPNVDIAALCDVDTNRAAPLRRRFPKARFHEDYRRMFDRPQDFDAVVIATPDHHHALPTMAALRLQKHVYCEKPLTHTVHEAQQVIAEAARQRVVTQMGTQIHAGDNYRRVVEIVQSDTLGAIRRVHVWCSRRPDAGQLARARTDPPAGLNYDVWLGPAPQRHYHASHLHFNWRWWWDFGGGVLADMACHFMDLPHWALGLRLPTSVVANGRYTHGGDNPVPTVLQVDYEYPARGTQPPVQLTWYHGVPGPDLEGRRRFAGFDSGVLFEGERGQLLADYSRHQLLPQERFQNFQPPQQTIARSVGHHREWVDAIRTGGTTTCNFAYSGPLAISVLLGNVAYRTGNGERLQYDAATGRITNNANAAQYVQRAYRQGWTL